MIRQLLLVFTFGFSLISCESKKITNLEINEDSSVVEAYDTTNAGDFGQDSISSGNNYFSFTEIISTLPENTEELEYGKSHFDKYASSQKTKGIVIARRCDQRMLPDSILCSDSVFFVWKMTMEKYTLINLMTKDWNAKGQSIMYHLITADNKTGKLIDCITEWAALYAVSVENPNGGSSAGVEYTIGSLETNPALTLFSIPSTSDSDANSAFELSSDGHFVAPYARFEAERDLQ